MSFCSEELDPSDAGRFSRIRPDHPRPGNGQCLYPGDGDRLTFTLKRFITDKDPVLTKTLGQGIRQEQDSCVLVFLPEDTRHLSCGRYIYEVKLVRGTGYTDTIIPARDFFLERSVMERGTE